jgi:DNA-binding Lrp family transcriptional regulator
LTNEEPLKGENRTIDDLDKQILQQMSKGISSYEELAQDCNVTRSTVYRRVTSLEKRGLIHRITRTIVDYEQLGIVTICFASKMSQANQKRAFTALKSHKKVKLLWRTYGDHNLIFLVFCERGDEGEIISEMKTLLEKHGATDVNVSVGFAWEKTDFSPFSDETPDEKQLKLYCSDDEQITSRQAGLKFVSVLKE